MKKRIVLPMAILFAMLFSTACSPRATPQTDQKITYSCPMHPEVVSDKPGTCPKCGMDLVADNGKGGHNHKGCNMKSGGGHDHSGGGCGMMR